MKFLHQWLPQKAYVQTTFYTQFGKKFHSNPAFHTSRKDLKFFHLEGNDTQEQVAQTGCGVFILGDIQNWSVQGPEQPALVGPALSRN